MGTRHTQFFMAKEYPNVAGGGAGGSSVVPNPTGTATDTLDTIGIDGTIYDFAGGGVHYSTTEQVIGTWIDGKPLYQKTIVANNKRMGHPESDSEILHGVNNIEFGFVEKCLFNQSDGNGYVDGTVVVSTVNQQVYTQAFAVGSSKIYSTKEPFSANTNRTWIITIRYTKTTD